MRSRALAGREAGLTARRACMLRPWLVDSTVYAISTEKRMECTIFNTGLYRGQRNKGQRGPTQDVYLPAALFAWLSDLAALAAFAPAMRPNTEPLVRPVPPG